MRSRKKSNHSLNVRVNSKKSIRVRRKIFFMKALKWSAVMMLAGLVLIGAYRGIDSFLFESPKFSLRNISYETDGDLPKQRILKFSGIEIGDNILFINEGKNWWENFVQDRNPGEMGRRLHKMLPDGGTNDFANLILEIAGNNLKWD